MPTDLPESETCAMTSWSPDQDVSTAERPLLAGRYEIVGLIGSGGMGTVYRARDRELDEVVALKMLRQGMVGTDRVLERFRREVKLARRVTHVNVARTYDIGEHSGEKFLTMELVDGESLSALLARDGAMSAGQTVTMLSATCAGLCAAHDAGVVHRDLKPDNVLIAKDGRVVITDFGVACVRADAAQDGTLGGVVGTPAYMAPEQVEGREIDARADIYALGVMMFEMLTGRMPFEGETPFTIATARLTRPPPDPRQFVGLPSGLAEVVLRCMARDREQRFATAAQVQQALMAVAPTMATITPAPPSSRRAPWRAPEPRQTAEGERTLAVLPFRNTGQDTDDYLADGLTEDLIDTLSMSEGLRVRPRASVLPFKGSDGDPRELGKQLGVDVVVDASLRRSGENLRITVRLLSVADGFQLWAKRFDGHAGDLLVVCDEAAAAIADALSSRTQQSQRQALTSPQAVELYLHGRSQYRSLWRGAEKAVASFAQAHQLAPRDPTILSAYARAQARLWFQGGAKKDAERARELSERALAVAPERGESWLALASVRFVELDLTSAARYLRQALSRSPQLPEAHELLGDLLMEVGELDDSVARHRTASLLDPTLRNRYTIARAYGLQGRFTQAMEVLADVKEDAQATIETAALCARLALWQANTATHLDAALRAGADPSISPLRYVDMVRRAVERGGADDALAREIDEEFINPGDAPRFVALKHQLACEIMAWSDRLPLAEQHLRRAVSVGLADENWVKLCPVLAKLRATPAYATLTREVVERAARARGTLENETS